MLNATSSTELVEWFAFLRIDDERRREEQERAFGAVI